MAFQFGFGDDDDDNELVNRENLTDYNDDGSTSDIPPVKEHRLQDLLDTLPERISYNLVEIETAAGNTVLLPRRDLHDVRVQLLCEGEKDDVIDQLDKLDIRSGLYEGGFKTWECSQDLASFLANQKLTSQDYVQVVELGAGTALPTLVLFRNALLKSTPFTFVLQDYNDFVLSLVTLPNILLTWAIITEHTDSTTLRLNSELNGDFEINDAIKQNFLHDLRSRRINLVFLSGPWSHSLADLIPQPESSNGALLLATETVYSPTSTVAFVELLTILLGRVKESKAIVGAKRVYFGVGGSVNGMKEACQSTGVAAREIEDHGLMGMEKGVGRALIEVSMPR